MHTVECYIGCWTPATCNIDGSHRLTIGKKKPDSMVLFV